MMKKESKNVLYKEMDLVRLLSLYQSTAMGFLEKATSFYLVSKTR